MLECVPGLVLWLMLLPDEVDMLVEAAGAGVVDCPSASADDVASNPAAAAAINEMCMKFPLCETAE
jgi:hypothetical protein